MRLLMLTSEEGIPVIINPERVCWLSTFDGKLVRIDFGGGDTIWVKGELTDVANRLGRLTSSPS